MAIHEDVPGISVQILDSCGNALQEHEAVSLDSSESEDEPSHPSTFRYVEAKSGQTFAIKRTFEDTFSTNHRIISNIYMDEECVDSTLWDVEGLMDLEGHLVEGVTDWEDNMSRLSCFRFSQLDIWEDDAGTVSSKSVLERVASIKTISVQFWEVCNLRQNTVPPNREDEFQLLKDSRVSPKRC